MSQMLVEFDYDDEVEFDLIDERSVRITCGNVDLVIHPPEGSTIQNMVDAIQEALDDG